MILLSVTLNGLSNEYESFIDSIMLRIYSTTLDELHGLLINKESFMNRKKKGTVSSAQEPFQAFAAQSQGHLLATPLYYLFPHTYAAQFNALPKFQNNHGNGKGPYQRNNRGIYSKNFTQFRGSFHNFRNGSGYFRNNFGGNRYNSSGFNCNNNKNSGPHFGGKNPCQICHSFDHEAIDCYERMNHAFAGKIPPAKLVAMCVHTNSKTSSPTWLIDYSATSHVTNDIDALHSPIPYSREDKVYIGDGQGMSINHCGISMLKTPSATFRLNNVLHVPKMKFNLLSAYQFLKDNSCALTLDSNGSTIKDRSMGMMLFEGLVREGFYPFQGIPLASAPSAFLNTNVSLQTWHRRLGHPSIAIFRNILNKAPFAHSGGKSINFFCTDCAIGKNHKLPFSSSTSTSL